VRERHYLSLLTSSATLGRELSRSHAISSKKPRGIGDSPDSSRLGKLLVWAGIPLSVRAYTMACLLIGLLLILASWNIGPIFSIALGFGVGYELLISYPRDRAARRERLVALHLPLCAETLGEKISSGMPFSTALVETLNRLPPGPLRSELDDLVKSLQKGVEPSKALSAFKARLIGPEVRSFCAALKMYCMGGVQMGEPLVKLAAFIREHRLVTDSVAQRVSMVRQTFAVLMSALSLACVCLLHFLPSEVIYSQSEVASLTRELGALLIIVALIAIMRLTAHRNWEIDDVV
jgi:Flp pilus assembly protein TadB